MKILFKFKEFAGLIISYTNEQNAVATVAAFFIDK